MSITFSEYFDRWFATYREPKIRDVTARKYINTSNQIEKFKLGKKKLKEVSRKDIQEFLNEYGSTRRKNTVLDTRRLINASLVDAVHDGLIKTNPCARTEIVSIEDSWNVKKLKKVREEKKWLEFDEYKSLRMYLLGLLNTTFWQNETADIVFKNSLNEVVSIFKPKKCVPQMTLMVIYVALKTGARFGEILGLTKDDIDFKNKMINIDKTWDYKFGEKFVTTKNISSIREVSVDREFMAVMDSYFKWLEKRNIETDHGAIFVEKGSRVFNSTYNNILTLIFKCLEIERITLHKLRHTQASILIAQGISLQVVAKRLGHTDTNMIQTTYGHLLESVEESENVKLLELI